MQSLLRDRKPFGRKNASLMQKENFPYNSTVLSSVKTDQLVISLKGVSKKFCRNLKRSMFYGLSDVFRVMAGLSPPNYRIRKHEFWAIKDVTFDIARGGILGLMGQNGSGKTTLLRMLAGILPPDRGEILVKGRIASLIALGAGFPPHMTGRENIFLNATLLGMEREHIHAFVPDIIDFSELEDFIDSPVATYSSGMRIRLGFAIAVQSKPTVFLIDEALAVGDQRFKLKCFRELERIAESTTVIIASHSAQRVSRLCQSIKIMEKGQIIYASDNVQEGINYYHSRLGIHKDNC